MRATDDSGDTRHMDARKQALLVDFGMGLGLLGYRTVYGLLRPLPDQRLEHTRWLRGDDRFGDLKPP